jgi:peptidase A4-like protein
MSSPTTRPEWAFDEKEFLRKIPYPVTPTNLKGAYAMTGWPDSFDPNTASSAELIKNGILWRRPTANDEPALRQAWDKIFSRKWLAKDRIIPVLEPQVGTRHVLKQPPKALSEGSHNQGAWAGAYTNTGGPYASISGFWRVPTVSAASEPPSAKGTWDYEHHVAYDSSSWVGIDGAFGKDVSNDVLQAGIQHYVDTSGKAYYVPWYEWAAPDYYNNQVNFSKNVPVAAGDEICVAVQYVGTTAGTFILLNFTTGKHFGLTLYPPMTATFSGDTVEWIVEDPGGGEESGYALANFNQVEFTYAIACTAAGVPNNPQNDLTCNIETAGKKPKLLTKVTLGNYAVTIKFIG